MNNLTISNEYHKGLFEVENNKLIIFNKYDDNWIDIEFDKIKEITFQYENVGDGTYREYYDVEKTQEVDNQITFTFKNSSKAMLV